MNNRILITVLFFITCLTACTFEPLERTPDKKKESNYCVTLLHNSADSILLEENEWKIVQSLFELNDLELHSFQIYQLQGNELEGYRVGAHPFVNGLQVFGEDIIFHFDTAQVFSSLQGHLIPALDLDTVPTIHRDTLIGRYLELLDKDEFYIISGAGETIKKGCFEIELGYFNSQEGTVDAEPGYVKVWMVKPRGKDYPYATIDDSTSTVLRYDNGVR